VAIFKIGEFINMAIKDEQTGEAFYRAIAETTNNEKVKTGLLKIADQENSHAKRFYELLTDVGEQKPAEEYDGQYEKYLNVLLTNHAFPTPEAAAKKVSELTNDYEGVMMSLNLEKDALLFYEEIKRMLPDTHKNIVADIIKEERVHLEDLINLADIL